MKRLRCFCGLSCSSSWLLLLLLFGAFQPLAALAASSPARAGISLASGLILPGTVPETLALDPAGGHEAEYLLVKFPGPVTAAQLEALERETLGVYTYLPHDAFLVKVARERLGSALETAGVTAALGASWTGLYHPAYKVAPAVAAFHGMTAAEAEASKGPGDGRLPVLLHVYPDADLGALLGRLRALVPGAVVGAGGGKFFARVRLLLSAAEIASRQEELARLHDVFWVALESRRVLLNDTTVWVGQSGLGGSGATPVHDRGILGAGQVVAVLDTGIDPDMCFFRDPVRGLPPRNECDGGTVVDPLQRKVLAVNFLWSQECVGGISNSEWDTHDHGSHVAGTAAGDDLTTVGVRDTGDGMAPAAKLVIQDGGLAFDNCADLPGLGCPVVDLNPIFQQAYDQGARIHNNSWGDQENAPVQTYSAGSQDSDEFVWNHRDFLLVYAAGNAGPGSGTIVSPSNGKNVLSVGATLRGTSAESMAGFSSCGPTLDGRIKPDVTIPGSGIVSANNDTNASSNNCGTRTMSGTSMASPGAAGLAALVRQYYADGFYPTGAANAPDAFQPTAALVKATMMNSAQSMTGVGHIPSICQGWGRLLLDNTLHFTGETRKLWAIDEGPAFPAGGGGQSMSFDFDVETGEPFKATLAWTDFPATPAANPTLVNDLDLEVTGPAGTFLGNIFILGQSATGGTADRLNSVEQVLLANPPAGRYTVTVRAFNVPSGPQPFALVIHGDLVEAGPESLYTDGFETGDTSAWTLEVAEP